MREKPEHADLLGWNDFVVYADEHGFGEHPEDWTELWDLWARGYATGWNDRGSAARQIAESAERHGHG